MPLTNQQFAALLQGTGDLSADEMGLQEQLAYAKSLREGLPQGRSTVNNLTRALGGVGEGMARQDYRKGLGEYGLKKQGIVDRTTRALLGGDQEDPLRKNQNNPNQYYGDIPDLNYGE